MNNLKGEYDGIDGGVVEIGDIGELDDTIDDAGESSDSDDDDDNDDDEEEDDEEKDDAGDDDDNGDVDDENKEEISQFFGSHISSSFSSVSFDKLLVSSLHKMGLHKKKKKTL